MNNHSRIQYSGRKSEYYRCVGSIDDNPSLSFLFLFQIMFAVCGNADG